jgi:hypothetical protein
LKETLAMADPGEGFAAEESTLTPSWRSSR